MNKKKCLNCGRMVSADASFCTNCGKPFPEDRYLYCNNCGAPLSDDMNFCTQCGGMIKKDINVNPMQREQLSTMILKNDWIPWVVIAVIIVVSVLIGK